MHRDACLAHRRGEQSGALLDQRMACLHDRRTAVDTAIAVLGEPPGVGDGDGHWLENAPLVVQKLPRIERCGDLAALAADVPPPEDARTAEHIAALRVRLSRAEALEHAGRYDAALRELHALTERAEPLGHEPFTAEALLVKGRVLMNMGDRERALPALEQASVRGLAAGVDAAALEALARRMYLLGIGSENPDVALAVLPVAEALVQRIPDRAFVHALLLNNAGAVYMAAKSRDRARALFERALAIAEAAPGAPHIELTTITLNLLLITENELRSTDLVQSGLARIEQLLGASHPLALDFRNRASHFSSDPRRARELLAPACSDYERYHPELPNALAQCRYYLAFLEAELGDGERAAAVFDQLAADLDGATAPEPAAYREFAKGSSHLLRRQYSAACASLATAVALIRSDDPYWWVQKRLAHALLGLGVCQRALGRRGAAIASLDEALGILTQLVDINRDVEHRQRLARAQVELAEALWDATPGEASAHAQARSGAKARAAVLVAEAEAWYRTQEAAYEHRLAELTAWRAARGLRP
jgi:tetratricopeptide (TPR) repeat protein